MDSESLSMRINGVLPDVDSDEANTSVSIFHGGFHLLIDAGNKVADILAKGGSAKARPDAVLITNSRKQHISSLPDIAGENVKVYCTKECGAQIAKELPSWKGSPVAVTPGVQFEVGPFSVTPIAAENSGDVAGAPGSVIYVVSAGERKLVTAWDFLTLPNANENLLWNPDVLILGTETYNEHPSTGMISVSEAYNLVRRWNAKTSYLLHYSGEKDREDAKNQWHRGPEGPLSPEALQAAVDDHLKVSGAEGKFAMTVARPGMTWAPQEVQEDSGEIGPKIEVDALDRHSLAIEKVDGGKVAITIEDSINRMITEFVNPKSEGQSLHADAIKSMMMKGPELQLAINGTSVKIDITKGKKAMFAGELQVTERDSKRLARYLAENFR